MHNKVCQSPRLPERAVLVPNLHHGRQDSANFEARTSVDHQSKDSEEYEEAVAIAIATEEPKSSGNPKRQHRLQNIRSATLNCLREQDDTRRETRN